MWKREWFKWSCTHRQGKNYMVTAGERIIKNTQNKNAMGLYISFNISTWLETYHPWLFGIFFYVTPDYSNKKKTDFIKLGKQVIKNIMIIKKSNCNPEHISTGQRMCCFQYVWNSSKCKNTKKCKVRGNISVPKIR